MQKTTAFGCMLHREKWARVQQKLNVPFIMKVSLVVVMSMLLSAQLLIARDGFGQRINEKQITLELRDASLRNALNRIEKLSGFRLAYILEQVAKYKNINLKKDTRSVAATLQLILATTQLNFKQDNNTILIYPKEKSSPSLPFLLLSGLFLGMSVLTRPNILPFAIVLFLLILFKSIFNIRNFKYYWVMLISCFLFALLLPLRNYLVTGELKIVAADGTFFEYMTRANPLSIFENPQHFFGYYLTKIRLLLI